MHERSSTQMLSEVGLLVAGLALTSCGNSQVDASQKPIEYAPIYRCEAHMYALGEITVSLAEIDVSHLRQNLTAQRITAQLPHKGPVSKAAHHNQAHFDIPHHYSQIFVKAKTHGKLVACSTIMPSHYN